MKVIALYADAMESGKTTAAQLIEPYGYRRIAIAEPMKAMIADLLRRSGYVETFIHGALYGQYKNDPIQALGGISARQMMQKLGTEWGRGLYHGIWLAALGRAIEETHAAGFHVVIDDMRYLNEMTYLVNIWGAKIVKVIRPGMKDTTGHSSEGELRGFVPDTIIFNDRGPRAFREHLADQVKNLVS